MRNGILLSLLMAVSMPALAVYKCESHGRVTYTDLPCGAATMILPPPLPQDAGSARRLAEAERRQLAAIEKRQESERAVAERERSRHKQDKSGLAHKKKCAKLELDRKWSAEDAATESHTVSEKTMGLTKTARRKAERYDAECGAGQQ